MAAHDSLVGRRLNVTLVLGMVAAFLTVAAAQTDPHVGIWHLNVGKSVYDPGPPPRSQTRTYTPNGDGVSVVIETMQPFGAKTITKYSAHYDGKDNPLIGNDNADSIAVTRIDAWTFESTTKKGGKVVSTVRNTVAKDGKTMVVASKGVNAQGRPVTSTIVLVRQ